MSTEQYPKYTAAVVQAAPVYFDLEGTVAKTIALIEEAALNGARLIVFPETWIPGYPLHAWLSSPAWAMQWSQLYSANSLRLGSAEDQRIADAAADHNIHVVLGCSERDGESLYMTQVFYDPSGRRTARRKLMPTGAERMVFGQGDGSDLIVRDTELGRLGALSCWEHLQPLSKFALYEQGMQVLTSGWPSFSMYPGINLFSAERNINISQLVAGEGGAFVLAATSVTTPEIVEQLCAKLDPREREVVDEHKLIAPGGGRSMAFAPDGKPMAEYLAPEEEGLICVELDLSMIPLAKAAYDCVGHSSRSDVAQLLFHNQRRRPVVSMAAPCPPPDGNHTPHADRPGTTDATTTAAPPDRPAAQGPAAEQADAPLASPA